MAMRTNLVLKRAYEQPSADDGERILVERLWPRGLSKGDAHLDGWLKDIAPSPELRRWFGHAPERWTKFRQRYEAELEASEKQPLLAELAEKARSGRLTLVFAASDTEHNAAVVLNELVERRLRNGSSENVSGAATGRRTSRGARSRQPEEVSDGTGRT